MWYIYLTILPSCIYYKVTWLNYSDCWLRACAYYRPYAWFVHSSSLHDNGEDGEKIISSHHPTRQLRSSSVYQFFKPAVNSNFASQAFPVSVPSVWNSLKPDLRCIDTSASFKSQLKTTLFLSAYGSTSHGSEPSTASDSIFDLSALQIVLYVCICRLYVCCDCRLNVYLYTTVALRLSKFIKQTTTTTTTTS